MPLEEHRGFDPGAIANFTLIRRQVGMERFERRGIRLMAGRTHAPIGCQTVLLSVNAVIS